MRTVSMMPAVRSWRRTSSLSHSSACWLPLGRMHLPVSKDASKDVRQQV